MKCVVVPIEEGRDTAWAVEHVIGLYRSEPLRIYLLNVQPPLPRYVARFINKNELQKFHRESGMRALAPAIERLDAAGVPHLDRVLVGRKAESIVDFAREVRCAQIILPRRAGVLPTLGLGSIGSQLRHLIGAGCDICEVY
ncbi:MAG: universal stress protein [Burkholderiales bacterium]